MGDSFVMESACRAAPPARRRKVLVTGAAGRIGSYFAAHAAGRYELTLMVHPDADAADLSAHGRVVRARLGDLEQLKEHFAGQDTIVHLAANPAPDATWDSVQRDNITGTYHAFVAAESAGCRRVVYASSVHAVSGYAAERQVHADEPVNPGDLYGVSKCFGEAMGRYLAVQRELSVICIRIGTFLPRESAEDPQRTPLVDVFVSRRDLHQLIERCIDNEDLRFAIVHGLSNNRFHRMDVTEAKELVGYEPVDDLSERNPALRDVDLGSASQSHSEASGQEPGIREEL